MNDVTESRSQAFTLIEIAARWEAMVDILKGEEVSDFLLSFPEVRQLADIMASQPGVQRGQAKECACMKWEDGLIDSGKCDVHGRRPPEC